MSVVLYHTAEKAMIGDTRAYAGRSQPIGNKHKVFKVPEGKLKGSLLGITSSTPGNAELFRRWVFGSQDPLLLPDNSMDFDVEALLVTPNGEVFHFLSGFNPSGPLTDDVFSIGTGCEYALGAFRSTGNAYKAVETAISLDTMCGGTPTVVYLYS